MRIVTLFRKSPVPALVLFVILISGALSLTPAQQKKSIILATTTSTEDSGLLDVLIPVFERSSGYIVKTISVGSGQALKMGEKERQTSCSLTLRMPKEDSSNAASPSIAG